MFLVQKCLQDEASDSLKNHSRNQSYTTNQPKRLPNVPRFFSVKDI